MLCVVQYANIPDGSSHRGVPRYYRAALDSMDRAVSGWLERGAAFGMHLGDILDGYHPKDESDAALTELLRRFSRLNKPVYHMLGEVHIILPLQLKNSLWPQASSSLGSMLS